MIIEAMKLAAEFNRYFTSGNGVDVPAKVSVSRDEWRALLTAIQQAEAQQPSTGEPVTVQALEAIAKGDLGGLRYLESSEAMVIRMQSIAATAIKSIIHGSQGALKCTNGTQNTLPQQQKAGAVGDTKTPENGFQGPLAQGLSTKAGASQVEPFAHICIVNTKDAGPTKFFTAPSDPRAIPVYTHPAPSVPAKGEPVAWNSIQIASWIGSQLMHQPSMFERATVCKFVRSLGRHPTLLKHSR
jgi:hypothetical protein